MNTSYRHRFLLLIIFPGILLFTGCASTPDKSQLKETEAVTVFYPPIPDEPRIQYLTTFSAAEDVEKNKKTGMIEFVLGDEGKSRRALTKPYGIALYNGGLYVVDTRGGGYAVFDLKNNAFRSVTGMQKPINIYIDTDGTKYITDTLMQRVLIFDHEDKLVDAFGEEGFGEEGGFKPSDVIILGNKLFVSDLVNNQIQVLDKNTGKFEYSIGKAGSKEGELIFPTNLATGPDNNIYVTDTANFRVQVFTPEGKYLRTFGSLGMELGRFARPKGVAVDRKGRVHVVDAAFQNVQLFNSEGNLLMFYAGSGIEPGQLYLPTDISIDYDNLDYFQSFVAPGFKLEYVILVSNQFGPNKVNVYGFGEMADETLHDMELQYQAIQDKADQEKALKEKEISEKAIRDKVIQDEQDYQQLQ